MNTIPNVDGRIRTASGDMQRFELLGGKYQQGEQILPGAVQSFRGYELPTGRPVFIHRIPSKEAAAEEIAGLLSAGLIQSAAVRKAVLDVYEGEAYRFLVTEPDRHCVPLQDWLEREAGELPRPGTTGRTVETAPHPLELETAVSEPVKEGPIEETRISPEAEATEFARMFRAALAGKMERVRRDTIEKDEPVIRFGPTGRPATQEEVIEAPTVPAPVASATPELFSQAAEAEKGGRSTLVVLLALLGVVVVLLVMFVVVFVKR